MKKLNDLRLVSLFVAALAMLTLPAMSASAADLKVLVVSNSDVMQGSNAGKSLAVQLKAIFETIQKDERAEMEPLAKEAQELQGQKALLGDGFVAKQRDLQRKIEFTKYKYEQERKYTQEGAQQVILQNVFPIYKEIMKEQNGTMLMDKSQLIIMSPDYDITEEVMKRLDKALPTTDAKRITFAELQKAFEEQQARLSKQQGAKK